MDEVCAYAGAAFLLIVVASPFHRSGWSNERRALAGLRAAT
jgi:hypothetical protein